MKNILFLILFTVFGGASYSQGSTLVFNQVRTFSNQNITTSPYTIATVPAGKVWKVEFMAARRYTDPNPFSINTGGTENDPSVFSQTSSYNPFIQMPSGPVWLKAGDVIKVYYGSSSYPSSYFISAIEFDVVPNP